MVFYIPVSSLSGWALELVFVENRWTEIDRSIGCHGSPCFLIRFFLREEDSGP